MTIDICSNAQMFLTGRSATVRIHDQETGQTVAAAEIGSRTENVSLGGNEIVTLEHGSPWIDCCHKSGDLAFDSGGSLYISVRGDTSPFERHRYPPQSSTTGT